MKSSERGDDVVGESGLLLLSMVGGWSVSQSVCRSVSRSTDVRVCTRLQIHMCW